MCYTFFFFNDTATTEIYTLSLHDALPIWIESSGMPRSRSSRAKSQTPDSCSCNIRKRMSQPRCFNRSEEHTSELQSQSNLVCRLLLEKKKKKDYVDKHVKRTHGQPISTRP